MNQRNQYALACRKIQRQGGWLPRGNLLVSFINICDTVSQLSDRFTLMKNDQTAATYLLIKIKL